MDKQELFEREIKRVRTHPELLLRGHDDELIQDVAASFFRKFMRLFIIEFYFNGCRQFDFIKKPDNSFEFKAFALNKWSNIKGNGNDWKCVFCELRKGKDENCSFYEQATLQDSIYNNDMVGIDYLTVAQHISKYFDISIIKDNYKQLTAHFKDGYFVDCNEQNAEPDINQTVIRFKFEEKIFTDNFSSNNPYISSEDFYKIAEGLAMFFHGADITIFDEIEEKTIKKNFKYDSLGDYTAKHFNYDNSWCFEFETCTDETEKVQNNALIKIALTPCETKGKIEIYCDYRKIEYGTPFKAVEKALSETNRNFNVIIIIFQRYTLWTNAMKRGIENKYIYTNIYNHLCDEINKFSIWEKVLKYVKERVSLTAYELWIKTIKFHGIDNSKAILTFRSNLAEKMALDQYGELLQKAFVYVIGEQILIK